MIPNRDRLRLRIAFRPVLGLLIRGRAVPIPGPTCYVLRDRRSRGYVADPYGDRRGKRGRTPGNMTGKIGDAYRFVRRDLAERAGEDIGGGFDIVEIEIPP